MTAGDTSVVVVIGSAPGPVGLLDEALGRRLRDQLRTHGTAWLAASTHRRAGRELAAAAADEQAVTRAVAGRCQTMLVTAEHDRHTGDLLAEVASHAPGASVTVRLIVERQDRAAEHAIVAGMRNGEAPEDIEALEDIDATEDVEYGAVVRVLAALPFVSSVTARPYELVHGGVATWVDDLLNIVALRGRLDLRPLVYGDEPIAAYRGYSPRGLSVGRALLPELTTAAQYELLHEFLLESFPAGEQRLLPDARRAALVAGSREANREFFTEFLPDLPPDSYGDDAATALLAQIPVSVRVPRPAPHVTMRSLAGTARRNLRRRVHRGA